MAYSVSQILQIANVSEFLAADSEAQGNLFRGSYERKGLSRLIYIVTASVNWLYSYNSVAPTLLGKANYLFSLCQPFVGQALQIIGSGGSGTIINPATGVVSTIVAKTVEFRVGDAGALLTAGQTSFTLAYSSILNSSVSIELDGAGLPPTILTDRISYAAIYSTPSVTINLNQGAIDQQVYVIRFLQYVTI